MTHRKQLAALRIRQAKQFAFLEEVARLARKGLIEEQIAERMSASVLAVRRAMIALEQQAETGR